MLSFFHPFNYLRKPAIVICCVAAIGTFQPKVYSQDVHFSLYENSPLYLNPANTGNFTGDWRLSGIFRNQNAASADPFRTTTVSFDSKFRFLKQRIGYGVYFMNDESGVGGLTFNKAMFSLSYRQEINKHYFTVGIQAGYVSGSVNQWGNWNYDQGDFTAPNGENSFNDKSGYIDVNAGLHWKRSIKRFEPEVGISLSHLNKPNISFTEGELNEDYKLSLNTRVKINITDKLFITPALLFVERAVNSTMVGTQIGLNKLGNKSAVKQIYTGVFLRDGLTDELNTLAFIAGTTINRIDVAVSYDMNMGQLGDYIGNTGAFEISFIYKSISTVLNSYSIPCERF